MKSIFYDQCQQKHWYTRLLQIRYCVGKAGLFTLNFADKLNLDGRWPVRIKNMNHVCIKVKYAELQPAKFRTRLQQKPLAYLPPGKLEWHGEYLPHFASVGYGKEIFEYSVKQPGTLLIEV